MSESNDSQRTTNSSTGESRIVLRQKADDSSMHLHFKGIARVQRLFKKDKAHLLSLSLRIQDINDILLLLYMDSGQISALVKKYCMLMSPYDMFVPRRVLIQRVSNLRRTRCFILHTPILDDSSTRIKTKKKTDCYGRIERTPQVQRCQRDKANARAMIQAIDKRLKTRRIMRSLERFVGGRPYGGDLRLLQRTI
ncbi:hypothetical protein Tco_0463069 [Tanacetum coccineum]